MSAQIRVGIVMGPEDLGRGDGRALMHGFSQACLGRPDIVGIGLESPGSWPDRGLSGVVMAGAAAPDRERARRLGIAMVDLDRIPLDQAAAGRLAARHLRGRGCRRLASVLYGHGVMEERWRGAVTAWGADGVLPPFRWADGGDYNADVGRLRRWLLELPSGTGILACEDIAGATVVSRAVEVGRRIPDELAVIGIDNDELWCLMARPALSSVIMPYEARGAAAARLLLAQLAGLPPPPLPLLAPQGVLVRASSDGEAVDDPAVAVALHHLRRDLETRIDIDALARSAGLSRRRLEVRFRAVLGRSPAQEIRRARLERAGQLLMDTTLTVGQVAQRVGLPDLSSFVRLFHRANGVTPAAWRRKHG